MTGNDNQRLNRRQLLKWTGATGLAGLSGLAGCTGNSSSGNDSSGGGGSGGGESSSSSSGNSGGQSDQILLKTAGGSPGGIGYAIMNAMLSGASAAYPKISYNILPGGWVGNNTRLQNEEIDMGHTTLAAGTLAANLNPPYDKYKDKWSKPPENIRSVLADQSELYYFVVAQPDFKYDTLTAAAEDDYAIKVTNQPKGTFGGFIWDTVLNKLNYSQDKINKLGGSYRRVGWNDAAQLFSDGQVDAILAVGGRDLGWLNQIAANKNVKYLNWNLSFAR
ncbi:MAG: TAXI family TRAP transporter solute-binding subunit [Salinigranum sp.]